MQEFRSPGDAAHIAVEHFLDILPDHRPAFCGSEHHVNQATCVAVRHDFDRGSYSHSSVPRTVVLGHSQPSLAGLVSVWECEPRTNVLGYSQPSLRDWTVHFSDLTVPSSHLNPGLSSWAILSRPWRDWSRCGNVNPGLTSWATLSRPFGTGRFILGNQLLGMRRATASVTSKIAPTWRVAWTRACRSARR
jgi:hypothetical protein